LSSFAAIHHNSHDTYMTPHLRAMAQASDHAALLCCRRYWKGSPHDNIFRALDEVA
jgi:hypothetical protein